MKPALSVLIFTVSSGAGYGLLIWMLSLQLISGSMFDQNEMLIGGLTGLSLVTVGLLSSTLHLANPKNAWRAFSRFRTSWLSREGVFAVLFYPAILAYGLLSWQAGAELSAPAAVLGSVSILLAAATVICTGMIYASLKPIRQWHHPLTTPLYILFSLMSGSLLLTLLQLVTRNAVSTLMLSCFIVSLLLTAVVKLIYFVSIGKPGGETINSATGFSQAKVRLLDAGHSADTFLTNEFVFDAGAAKLLRLRLLMWLLAFVVPIAVVAAAIWININGLLYV
ncbi:MAG: dimethyl sulfoxide reductase anchor subunit, partial [Arenicella sp.]|nr:dimethyl sulfoxide reductase anchor subunit [Arenicella sp.]